MNPIEKDLRSYFGITSEISWSTMVPSGILVAILGVPAIIRISIPAISCLVWKF